MQQVRKVLPYLLSGIALCLSGFAYFSLRRKLSVMHSPDYAESCEVALKELRSWKRTVEGELESQFERIRTVAGRVDRAKRKESPPAEAGSDHATPELAGGLDDQSTLNALLAKRFHGVT